MDWKDYTERAEALKPRLFRTAILYLGSESAAEEALDEALYKGLLACRKLRKEEYFDTWLTRILLNVCADEKKRRRRFLDLEELPESAAETFDSLPLREAVGKLPEELKRVVILRFFSDYTLRETADILGIPQGTAATRQRRALALLRLEFGEEMAE